jgi:hypothetical protein
MMTPTRKKRSNPTRHPKMKRKRARSGVRVEPPPPEPPQEAMTTTTTTMTTTAGRLAMCTAKLELTEPPAPAGEKHLFYL